MSNAVFPGFCSVYVCVCIEIFLSVVSGMGIYMALTIVFVYICI